MQLSQADIASAAPAFINSRPWLLKIWRLLFGAPMTLEVRAELINQFHGYEASSLLASVSTGLLFVWAMYSHQPRGLLLTWFSVKVGLVIYHWLAVRARRKLPVTITNVEHAERGILISTILLGATWGSAGYFFFLPDQVLVIMFLSVALLGVCGGLVAPMSSYWGGYLPFAILVLLPLSINCLFVGGELFITIGVMLITYVLVNIFYARASLNGRRRTVEIGFANVELVAQLREEKERVEAADRSKTKFLAAASHDLRQPIHALGMFTEVLITLSARSDAKPGVLKEVANKLQLSLKSLGGLLDALLDISKLDAGVVQVQMQTVPLQNLLDSLEREFSLIVRQKSLRLSVVPSDINVTSDPVLLKQILNNLVSNALRYTERGGIIVGAKRLSKTHVEVRVWDTGIGIDDSLREAVFTEFFQVANEARDRTQGLGLGLSIVRRTAALLGHKVTMRSEVGRGSQFGVQLPIEVQPVQSLASGIANTEPNWHSQATYPDAIVDASRFLVMLVDDDKEVLDAMGIMLNSWGYPTYSSASAASAVAKIASLSATEKATIGFVLSDYRLADGLNGADAIYAITNALARPVAAAIVTGDTSPARIRDLASSGYQVLHKPLDPASIREILRAAQAQVYRATVLAET
jgi:signal transduction histidine kinase/ActR/RegA family two-component response regulator